MDTTHLTITTELRTLVKAVIETKAWVEIVHPLVKGYQREILRELKAVHPDTGQPITDPDQSYLLSNVLAERYYSRCEEEAAKNGLIHKSGCCPLLEAESMEREAKKYLCEYLLPRLPILEGEQRSTYDELCRFAKDSDDKVLRDNLGRMICYRDLFIETTLKYLVPQMPEVIKVS